MEGSKINLEKLEKLRLLSENVRTGGKGTMRRKKKVVVKNFSADDKKLESTFRSMGLNPCPVEEVNMFKDDGSVLTFKNPKLNICQASNIISVNGKSEIKQLSEILPNVWQQLGPLKGDMFKKIAEGMKQTIQNQTNIEEVDDDDEGVPTLVTNFDEQSKLE